MTSSTARRTRRPLIIATVAVAATVAIVAGLWAFQPWRLFTSSSLDEALPSVTGDAEPAAATTSGSAGAPGGQRGPAAGSRPTPAPQPAPQPALLAEGGFVSQEHDTSGTAKIIQLADGARVLRLEGFTTSDGPDLHVWLTDQPTTGAWNSYDDGRSVRLGKLKATDGNQNYPIPADTALSGLRSVVIWCDRFNVAFGSAPLSL